MREREKERDREGERDGQMDRDKSDVVIDNGEGMDLLCSDVLLG